MPPTLSTRVEPFLERPFHVAGPEDFNALALDLFRLHAEHNPVYRSYLLALRVEPGKISSVDLIPALPVELFRSHRVLLEDLDPTSFFTSSGTTGSITATHHVPFPGLYERSFMSSFTSTYGPPSEWQILALLPAYLEREGSSLVYMAQHLIQATNDPLSGTYLHRYDALADVLLRSEKEGKKTLLLGVTFALLDLAEQHPMPLRHTTIMETGGMKGRRPELVRAAVHEQLKSAFHVEQIHSEYGMTELLSQAWSTGDGIYECPPWMRVHLRELNDPFAAVGAGRNGGINVIDLANVASCPFIATKDIGRLLPDGRFEVLGRFDNSDLRGCNLLVET